MRGILKDLTFGADGMQRITVAVDADFREDYGRLKDAEVEIDIRKRREPRSKDANAYFHLLVNKIAAAQHTSDDEVKKLLVTRYGTLARDEDGQLIGAMLPAGTDMEQFYPYARMIKRRTIGGRDYECWLFYKRTHTMDAGEMARLIDGTVSEAKELGIDTDTSAAFRPGTADGKGAQWQPASDTTG